MTLAHKAEDEIIFTIFKDLVVNKINELVVTSNKLTNYLAGLGRSGLGPDVARRLPVETRFEFLFGMSYDHEL
jgi:hypothetical protein